MSAQNVLHMPAPVARTTDGPVDLVRRRFQGSFVVDPWGLDPDLVTVATWCAALRWKVDVRGIEHLPDTGPVILVCNRRSGWSEPGVLVSALARASDRHVRPVGVPDIDPLGPVLRRFGAIPARPDEVAGALRVGEVVALPASRELRRFQLGKVPLELLEPAITLGAVVLPVAVTGWELGRRWAVQIGAPVSRPRGKGPRAVAELAVRTSAGLNDLLGEAERATLWHRLRHDEPGVVTDKN